jgi:SsrA-binding protein
MAKLQARRVAAQNRKARHNYFIDETYEAGIQLLGTEVKALRQGKGNIADAYAAEQNGELWLLNSHIQEYGSGGYMRHEEKRPRKLLLKKREIAKLIGATEREGFTLVPLAIVFNERGIAKVELGLGKGKKHHDKRASIKDRDWQRQKARLLKG